MKEQANRNEKHGSFQKTKTSCKSLIRRLSNFFFQKIKKKIQKVCKKCWWSKIFIIFSSLPKNKSKLDFDINTKRFLFIFKCEKCKFKTVQENISLVHLGRCLKGHLSTITLKLCEWCFPEKEGNLKNNFQNLYTKKMQKYQLIFTKFSMLQKEPIRIKKQKEKLSVKKQT